ncbi:hypothetical protein KY290_010560 [Solanum tuberosum]|uniref:Integrase core domain containing protein n=1 Tax=Solanum tuberosum TaxID=4113 RepID=A0ABQ7VY41_SOLTU|nr:hypothetical protein KY290_010560 [Solanum tuberosum]
MAVVVRVVGGDFVLDDSFARERVSSIARRIRAAQLSRRAPQSRLRLITKTDKQTTVKEWSKSATSLADGRWHIITLTIDADLGEATCYLDVYFDGNQTRLPLRVASYIRELGMDVWVGIRPPIDVDSFGRLDSEGAESKVHIMDVFLWGRYLTEDEIVALPVGVDLYNIDDVDWDGQWHIITLTIDADLGEATCYLDVYFDGNQTRLPLRVASYIRELGMDVWVGIRPPIDVDSFGRLDSEGAESKVHIMDVFLWGRYLTEDEIVALPVGVDLYNIDDVDWDGQWHIITLTIDADLGEATCYLDVYFDGNQTRLPLRVASYIRELGMDVWVGIRPPIDVDSFGRLDSEGAESKVHIMDVFLWGRYLTEDEIVALPVGVDLYNIDDVDWDGQYSSGRK